MATVEWTCCGVVGCSTTSRAQLRLAVFVHCTAKLVYAYSSSISRLLQSLLSETKDMQGIGTVEMLSMSPATWPLLEAQSIICSTALHQQMTILILLTHSIKSSAGCQTFVTAFHKWSDHYHETFNERLVQLWIPKGAQQTVKLTSLNSQQRHSAYRSSRQAGT